jgi:competence protein ComEA
VAALRERLAGHRGVAAAVGVAGAVVAGVVVLLLFRTPAGPPPQLTLPRAAEAVPGTGPEVATTVSATVSTVHAAGAVAKPGVYAVPPGARVADVLAAAGGPLPEADLDRLNLAAKVGDGDRVTVPRKGDPATPDSSGGAAAPGGAGGAPGAGAVAAAGPVDLNTATLDQLDTLPGVGPATAQAIITYRTRNGRFRSVTELLEVPGIGPTKMEALRPLVRV